MLVREEIEGRLSHAHDHRRDSMLQVGLPHRLKPDRMGARLGLLQRLAASKTFALGDRTGVLRAARNRSGRSFRLDVRQRVVVKALVCRHAGRGVARGAALARHLAYLGREGAGEEGASPAFFDRASNTVSATEATSSWSAQRHHFRFIVSPENGDRIDDLRGYVRELMTRVCADLGEPDLPWLAVCHHNTDQPHAHVLLSGRRADGRDLVIPRDYIAYGFRARAQELAQERLGDLSRHDAERRIWRETQADAFTGLDRRLLAARDADGMVGDGLGRSGAWAALTRGRLAHLEALGLARRHGRRFHLTEDMEGRLRRLQISRDVMRTLNQRRLESAREVRVFSGERVKGEVMKAGFHDELGASPYVVVRDRIGVEHYARLVVGSDLPAVGARAGLEMRARGVVCLTKGLGRTGPGLGL
ncbi:hypothetical protein D3C71_181980 [compost metagenome]